MSPAADQVSAYGQEPWAQQALADLRRGWPDWAFLVVRYRWLALRGKQVVISATGPRELRHALPPLPPERPEPGSTEAVPVSGSDSLGPVEHDVPEPDQVKLPTLAELLNGAPGVSWNRAGAPLLSPSSVACPHAGGDGGAGAGLCGPLTGDAPPLGVVAAERSVTGTWAVAGVAGVRPSWWQRGWWPWGRGRDRSRPGPRAGEGAPLAHRAEPAEVSRRRHGRARPRRAAAAVPVAV